MKINTNKYAEILKEALGDKNNEESSLIFSNFVKLLAKNNQLRYSSRIINKLKDLYNKESGTIEVEAISKTKLSEEMIDSIGKLFKKNAGVNEVNIENKINEKMLGGIILKTNEEIMDGSVDKQVVEMKKKLMV